MVTMELSPLSNMETLNLHSFLTDNEVIKCIESMCLKSKIVYLTRSKDKDAVKYQLKHTNMSKGSLPLSATALTHILPWPVMIE